MFPVPGFILIFPVCVSLVPDTQLCLCCTQVQFSVIFLMKAKELVLPAALAPLCQQAAARARPQELNFLTSLEAVSMTERQLL